MHEKRRIQFLALLGTVVLISSVKLFAAWTDQKPDSTPVTRNTSTCDLVSSGSCHKEQTDSCSCVDCPGLQEDLPNCDCVQQSGNAYWQSWDGTCIETLVDLGLYMYHCEFPSEPQQSGDKANQPQCGRAT